jgi:hypothetical protein
MTNATKALIGDFASCFLALLAAFGLGLTGEQVGAILAMVNVCTALYVALTYRDSPARKADDPVIDFQEARLRLLRVSGVDPVSQPPPLKPSRRGKVA